MMEIVLVSITVLAAIAFAKSVWSFSRELAERREELDEIENDIERLRGTVEAMKTR